MKRAADWSTWILLLSVIGVGLAVRLPQPILDKSIGEIDVYFWALRTQEFVLHGWAHIGTSFWVTPVVMGTLHRFFGGSLYDLFLWAGSFITGIIPPIGVFLLTKEISKSRAAGIFAALAIAINPVILYRSVFTVSETLAYVFIPWILYLAALLPRKKSPWYYLLLVAVTLVAMQTHDSSKLLLLPVAVSTIYYFWATRTSKITWLMMLLTVIGGGFALLHDQSIIAGIRFFLWPDNSGNSAFGKYMPTAYNEYVGISIGFLSVFSLAGFILWLVWKKVRPLSIGMLILFTLPILYYQQIQPRISESTIVPFRLTPYLAFIAAPLFGLAMAGWLHFTRKNRRLQLAILFLGSIVLVAQISPAKFPLSYVTGVEEQSSLRQLNIAPQDYLITQTSMIGMTSLATRTNESNYYGDTSNRIFKAQTAAQARQALREFIKVNPTRPTGILISKWKIDNRDPVFGWWDSLVNPSLKLSAWRSSGLPIRFEDANIIIFSVPPNF